MDIDRTFEWNGRQIRWGRAGDGPAVVFCHGTPFSSRVWEQYADALLADHTVVLWDMPGYGQSSKHEGQPVDFGSQAQALAALLDHAGLERPHVVAHDFGGAVSLRAHLVEGRDYASLMLVDVVAIPPSGSPFFAFVQQNPSLLDGLPAYVHESIVRTYVQNAAHHELPDDVLDTLVAPWTDEFGQPAFYRQIVDYDETYLEHNEELLRRIDVPVHIVWGTDDPWIPAERAGKLQRLIPGSTLRLVPDAGHLIQYDAPVALMHEIRAWLDAQGS